MSEDARARGLLSVIELSIKHLGDISVSSVFTKVSDTQLQPRAGNMEESQKFMENMKQELEKHKASIQLDIDANAESQPTNNKEKFKHQVIGYSLSKELKRVESALQFITATELVGEIIRRNKERVEMLHSQLLDIIQTIQQTLEKHGKEGKDLRALNQAVIDIVNSHLASLKETMEKSKEHMD